MADTEVTLPPSFSHSIAPRRRGSRSVPPFVAPALIALIVAGALPARAAPLAPGTVEIDLDHQGRRRFFLLHVPPQASAGLPLPVVLNFHGGGGEPRAHEIWTGMDAIADREGFIAIYPAGFSRSGEPGRSLLTWNAGTCCGPAQDLNSDDVGFVRKILIETNSRVPIDVTRVYATGHSNGAMMAYRLARDMSDQIAAIAPVAGASDLPPPAGARPMPLLHIHSVDDPRALYAGGEGPPFPLSDRRVMHPSVEAVLRLWARHDGCGAATDDPVRRAANGHTATRVVFAGCSSGKPVIHWRLTGAGHVWPGAPQKRTTQLLGQATDVIDGNAEIWGFFRGFSRPDAPALASATLGASTTASLPVVLDEPSTPARRAVDLPFSRSKLELRLVGARDRSSGGDADASFRSGGLSVRASTTLLGQLHVDRDGARASGLMMGVEGRALRTGLPVVADDDRFYRAGVSLGAFHLTARRQLYWLQLGTFVAEQGQLFDGPTAHVYGVGLGSTPLSETTTFIYGLGYTFDFGRGLPLPFLGINWRWSLRLRLDVLLPVRAQVQWQVTDPVALTFGTAAAGDFFRYRPAASGDTRQLRIARLRAGAAARWKVAPGVRLSFGLGVEGASIQDGVASTRAGGGYACVGLLLGGDGRDGEGDLHAAD
jgi:polyhydroxybutyrate depolymerase